MRFTYKDITYRIGFKHFNKPGSVRRTECSIYAEVGPKQFIELESNDAFCADGDNYCKAVGRKYALGRALIHMSTDRMFRHTAWMAYLNRGRVPEEQHKTQLIVTGDGAIQ